MRDAWERQERERQRRAWLEEKERLDATEREIKQADVTCGRFLHTFLASRGYHRHHRGEWRKRRG
jgi:hypothetical protein